MNAEAGRLVSRLGLVPLPREGGFYARTWTSPGVRPDGRPLASAILFLITPDAFSALHRLRMDEVWMFGAGDPAELVQIDVRSKACRSCILGPEVADGHRAQVVVPAGTWQGARLAPGGSRGWALFSCLVSPAWDETDFELGEREALVREYPAHAGTIRALTRGRPADAF